MQQWRTRKDSNLRPLPSEGQGIWRKNVDFRPFVMHNPYSHHIHITTGLYFTVSSASSNRNETQVMT